MTKVRIVTDSGADIPKDICEKMGVTVVPFKVVIGSKSYDDPHPDTLWKLIGTPPPYPKTSQPSPGDFQKVFKELTADGSAVICLTITSKHSGTFNSAWLASQGFEKVFVVDSRSVSLGIGFQVLEAAKAAQKGATVEEILALVEEIRKRTYLEIMLETLSYLKEGGRVNGIISRLEKLRKFFKLKLIITINKRGFLVPSLLGGARTTKRALEKITNSIAKYSPLKYLGVVHTRRVKRAELFAQLLAEKTRFSKKIWVGETRGALSSHAGPGVIGAIWVVSV